MQLTAFALATALVVFPTAAVPDADDPSGGAAGRWTSYTNTGSQVDVAAGSSGTVAGPGTSPTNSNAGSTPADGAPTAEDCPLDRCDITYDVVGPPEVTLEDLASFRPATPTLGGEPAGFGVVGMPTNLLAAASVQEIPGTVLDWPVTVRFTPVAYVFSHGDGTSARTTTGGRSWTTLRQGQFTPTPTSHVYGDRGTYTVSVTVEYAAAVNFGSGTWRPVPGTVRAASGGYDVRVVEVRTALVDRTCTEDPSGPGC